VPAVLLGVIAVYAAFALRFALQYCFSTLTFWVERASSIDQLTWIPYTFCSGLIIPLSDMPANIRGILYLTPFPYMIDFPARIFMGSLTWQNPELYRGFSVITVWFLLLSGLGAVLWKRGLLQYSGQGA
jgi:ABC-2 type transport system permease protein